LLTFAAAISAIISGGIAERARFYPQLAATAVIVRLAYLLHRIGATPERESNW
jgi:Amt family ammonium transporter